jgi:phenylpyruvate tautomerase PptA (4-oxalocrotonate tautomerase family)
MPYIGSKVTVPLTEQKKETLKSELGKIISLIPGKSESYLMIGFEDNYSLYFKGEKLSLGAFVEVKIFGCASKAALSDVTKEICALYLRELNIPPHAIYVKYEEVSNWGYNSINF